MFFGLNSLLFSFVLILYEALRTLIEALVKVNSRNLNAYMEQSCSVQDAVVVSCKTLIPIPQVL